MSPFLIALSSPQELVRLVEGLKVLMQKGTLQTSPPKITCPQAIVVLGVELPALLPMWHIQ